MFGLAALVNGRWKRDQRFWIDKHGDVHPIELMSGEHLENAIESLERMAKAIREKEIERLGQRVRQITQAGTGEVLQGRTAGNLAIRYRWLLEEREKREKSYRSVFYPKWPFERR